MYELPKNVRKFIAEQGASILTTNSQIKYVDLQGFGLLNDEGEGAVVL